MKKIFGLMFWLGVAGALRRLLTSAISGTMVDADLQSMRDAVLEVDIGGTGSGWAAIGPAAPRAGVLAQLAPPSRFAGRPFFVVGSFCCAPSKDAANLARKRVPFERYHWRWKMSTHYIGAAVKQPCGVRKSGLQDPGRLKDVKVIPRLGNPLLSPN